MSLGPGPTGAPGLGGAGRRRVDLSDLLPRVLSGLVMVAAAAVTAVLGGVLFVAFWTLAGVAILWEWQRLTGGGRLAARVAVGALAIVVAVLAALLAHPAWAVAVLLGAAAAVAWLAGGGAIRGVGVVYAGLLPVAVTLLRGSERYGLEAILWLFAVVWATDTMAYFGGRLIGGAKLWPRLSPSKTWSGFLVGIGAGAGAGLLVAAAAGRAHAMLLAVGLAAGMVAQGGDLFESALKRRFGAKDSSRLIPGHGGVMDRLDGFLAAAVFAVGFGMLRAGMDHATAGLLQW